MTTNQQTIAVPLDVVQSTANAIAEMPAGKCAGLFLAWQQLIEQHNQQAQAKREAEARMDKPVDPATERAVAELVNGKE